MCHQQSSPDADHTSIGQRTEQKDKQTHPAEHGRCSIPPSDQAKDQQSKQAKQGNLEQQEYDPPGNLQVKHLIGRMFIVHGKVEYFQEPQHQGYAHDEQSTKQYVHSFILSRNSNHQDCSRAFMQQENINTAPPQCMSEVLPDIGPGEMCNLDYFSLLEVRFNPRYLVKDMASGPITSGQENPTSAYCPEDLRPPLPIPQHLDLTEREIEVLRLIAKGATNRVIAEQLVNSEGTVKNHILNILSHLGLRDRTQAAIYAREQALL
jgi:DNA-binding CsgD family transcriptional regulator